MGNISEGYDFKKDFEFFDLTVAAYIIALFVFENAHYSNLFSFIQILFLGICVFEAIKRRWILKSYTYIWAGLFLFSAIILTSLLGEGGTTTLQTIFKNAVRCFAFSIYLSTNQHCKRIIDFIGIAGIVCSAFLINSYLGSSMTFTDYRYATLDRVGAEIAGGNVNIVAMNMAFSFTAWLILFNHTNSKVKKILFFCCMTVVAGTSLLTGSRKVLLYYLVVLMVYNLLCNEGKIKNVILMVITLLIAYYCLMNIEPLYYLIGHKVDFFSGNTLYMLYDQSDSVRSNLASAGLELFLDNLITGVGFGNTYNYFGMYTHNNYTEILACGGIIGFCVYYSMYLYIAKKCVSKRRNNEVYLFIFLALIGLICLEFSQVTYLYGVPWLFLTFSAVYCKNAPYFTDNSINS